MGRHSYLGCTLGVCLCVLCNAMQPQWGRHEYLTEEDAHALVGASIHCRRDWIRRVRPVRSEFFSLLVRFGELSTDGGFRWPAERILVWRFSCPTGMLSVPEMIPG